MKRPILIALVVLVALALIGGAIFAFAKSKNSKPVVEELVDEGKYLETALEDRPFVSLTPRADGKELTLEIAKIKNADSIDYELVYLAEGDLSRGVIGSIIYRGEASVSRELLLGSCSKNVCKYDEGVEGGTLTLKFRSEEGVRKFETPFSLQQGGSELTLSEEDFSLEADFPASAYYLVMSTIGLPGEVEGDAMAGPFGIFTSGSSVLKTGKITFKTVAGDTNAWVWKTGSWEELSASEEKLPGSISFDITDIGTYCLTKQGTPLP